jgi:hypothetical protein
VKVVGFLVEKVGKGEELVVRVEDCCCCCCSVDCFQVQGVVVANTISRELTINEGLTSKGQELSVGRETLTLLDHRLDNSNGRVGRDIKGKSVTLERLDKDLHV